MDEPGAPSPATGTCGQPPAIKRQDGGNPAAVRTQDPPLPPDRARFFDGRQVAQTIHLRSLDCLRGLLAVYVLAGHARWLLWEGHSRWLAASHPWWADLLERASACLRYGHEAVMVFFVLSGYFIHLRAANALASGMELNTSWGRYARHRIQRLLPPYALALLVTVGADLAGHHWFPTLYEARTGDVLLDGNFVRKGFSAASVVPALMLLPSSMGRDFGTNGPLWSLAYEIVYYMAYPIWLWLRRRGAVWGYGSVALLTILSVCCPAAGFVSVVAGHYHLWIAGAALAEWSCRKAAASAPADHRAWWLLGVAVAGMAALSGTMLVNLGIGVGMVLLSGASLGRWSQTRWFRCWEELGLRSYTIYICHFPLLALVSAWLIETRGGRPQSGWPALLGGACVLGVCLVFFHGCERHFLRPRLCLAPGTTGEIVTPAC